MAEAVKPKETTTRTKSRLNNRIVETNDSLSLEERFKALTEFVNGIITDKDEIINEQVNEVKEEVVNEDNIEVVNNDKQNENEINYYDKITQEVEKEENKNKYERLNHVLENIKITNEFESQIPKNQHLTTATAPAIDDVNIVYATAPPLSLTSEDIESEYEKLNCKTYVNNDEVIDFYADAIKEHQKNCLPYAKLKYFQLEKCKSNDNEVEDNDLDELDAELYENNVFNKELEMYFYSSVIENIAQIEKEFYINRNAIDLPLYYGKHEFYELLKDYYESRQLVGKCVKHIDYLKYECHEASSNRIWQFEKYNIESSAYCGDNIRLKHIIESEKAYLNREELNKLEKLLYELRFNIKCGLISSKFCSKLTYSKIESYLNEFFAFNSDTDTLNTDIILKFFKNNDEKINNLNILIDILFYFMRKKLENDDYYYKNLTNLLVNLLCIRLNVIYINVNSINQYNNHQQQQLQKRDFNFLIILYQNLIHLPNNYTYFDDFIDNYINISSFYCSRLIINIDSNNDDSYLNEYLNFYLELISLFSIKLKTREHFLSEYYNMPSQVSTVADSSSCNNTPSTTQSLNTNNNNNNNWQFIDLDGNLENIELTNFDIGEDCLIKLYNKLELNKLLQLLWQQYFIDNNQSIKTSKQIVLRVISFLTYITRLLLNSIIQYNRLKYKNFCKLLAKTLSDCLKYCSCIIETRQNNENENDLIHIKQHYNNFIKSICIKLIYYKNLNSIRWSLVSLLYKINELNIQTKWLILSLMSGIDIYNKNFNFNLNYAPHYIKQIYKHDLEEYIGKSKLLSDNELISYMRTLHFLVNLNSSNDCTSNDLFKTITIIIFYISYVYETTRDICHKDGNAILNTICLTYPNMIGIIMNEINKLKLNDETQQKPSNSSNNNNNQLEEILLSLINQLPFNLWFLCLNDFDLCLINNWLNNKFTNTFKFRCILICIEKLTYDVNNSINITNLNDYQLKEIKFAIILFNLYLKLTNQFNQYNVMINNNDIVQVTASKNENFIEDELLKLKSHYLKLNKDYKIKLINWLWSIIVKLNHLYIDLTSNCVNIGLNIEYISNVEASFHSKLDNTIKDKLKLKNLLFNLNQFKFCTFYNKYLMNQNDIINTSNNNSNNLQINRSFEYYLRLMLTNYGHNLNDFLDVGLILLDDLFKRDYLIACFNALEIVLYNILFSNPLQTNNNFNVLINNIKLIQHISKLFQVFSSKQLNYVFEIVYVRRLTKLIENEFNNLLLYLKLWFKLLLKSSIRQQQQQQQQVQCWFKCKNVLKYLDLTLQFLFTSNFINNDLLNEFLICVYIDFGLISGLNGGTPSGDEAIKSSFNSGGNIIASNTSTGNNSGGSGGLVSSWIQPSLNWITTLTSSNSSSSNVNNTDTVIDESNIQQQLTYDKHIYKEYSYLGFYLSLCEEHIENELELWSQFKYYLYVNTIDQLERNVENYWRKLILHINKQKCLNLNVNLSVKRLMLYKWCERASELELNNPLLLLYFQKFFNIYLNRSIPLATSCNVQFANLGTSNTPSTSHDLELQLQSNSTETNETPNLNGRIISATINYFSSTTYLNTFLKNMKKCLENATKYFKNTSVSLKDANVTSSTVSANTQKVLHYQNLTKIFYAFSLWIDETRLHDLNLYLPALPLHYESELLSKIFNKQFNLWYDCVNLKQIYENLIEQLPNQLILSKSTIATSTFKSSPFSYLFDKNSLTSDDEDANSSIAVLSKKLANVKFECAFKEKFGINLTQNKLKTLNSEQINLIKCLCENLLGNIYLYNSETIKKNLQLMYKLDEKYTKQLLLKLYHNELVEKYVQITCKSLINPLHQCTRPALIKFVYEHREKHVQTKHEIKENRHQFNKIIDLIYSNKNNFPNEDCVKSMISLQSLIKKLLTQVLSNSSGTGFHSSSSPSSSIFISSLLKHLFYLLIDSYEANMCAINVNNDDTTVIDYDLNTFISDETDDETNEYDLKNDTSSINLYLIDLINLIGFNYIRKYSNECDFLLDRLIKKLNTIKLSNVMSVMTSVVSPTSSSTTTNSTTNTPFKLKQLLLNSINSSLLIKLCALYVEPTSPSLFIQLYSKILNELVNYMNTDIIYLINFNSNNIQLNSNNSKLFKYMFDLIRIKYECYLELLNKFTIEQLKAYLIDYEEKSNNNNNNKSQAKCINEIYEICYKFVELNIEFLLNLKLTDTSSSRIASNFQKLNITQSTTLAVASIVPIQEQVQTKLYEINDKYIKLIINQCIDNFVQIVDLNYPYNLDYMLKTVLQFSSNKCTIQYQNRHLKLFINILKKRELLSSQLSNNLIDLKSFNELFNYLMKFFLNEFQVYEKYEFKKTFLTHWIVYVPDIADLYKILFGVYIDRYLYKKLFDLEIVIQSEIDQICKQGDSKHSSSLLVSYNDYCYKGFNKEYEIVWNLLVNLYQVWLQPTTHTSASSNTLTVTQSDCDQLEVIFDSFLYTFQIIYTRLTFNNELHKKYLLNRLFKFYYKFINSINGNANYIYLLSLYHKCMNKLEIWSDFEPDNESFKLINNILEHYSISFSAVILKFVSFTIVPNLDLVKITDNYYNLNNISPIEINNLLRCWLYLLTKITLNEQIRETHEFETKLRNTYRNCEENLQWSLLSDETYKEIVFDLFCPFADLNFAFATRGSNCGLYINVLKAAAEFYVYKIPNNSQVSCFATAKRRYFLKAICLLLSTKTLNKQQLQPQKPINNNDAELYRICLMNLLNDIEAFAISVHDTNENLKQEINLLLEEIVMLMQIQSHETSNNSNELSILFTNIIESWILSSKDSPLILNFVNRLSRMLNMLKNTEDRYLKLIELCIEIYFETMLNHTWQNVMNEIDLKPAINNETFELKCLENAYYLVLYTQILNNYAIIKASEINIDEQLYSYCEKLLNSFNASNQCVYSKPKADKEEKFFLILSKILEILLELTYFGYSHEKICLQLQQICSILLFNSEDNLYYQTPFAYQTYLINSYSPNSTSGGNTASSVLATIGLNNLLAKKSPLSIKFRFYSRCLAVAIAKQLNYIETKNEFTLRMSSNDAYYNPVAITNTTSTSSKSRILLQQHLRLTMQNFNAIYQNKTYQQFIEIANYAFSMIQAKEFTFVQLNNLINYLNKTLLSNKTYLFV